MVARVKLPVLHPENRLDKGLYASGAKFLKQRWYVYNGNDVFQPNTGDGAPEDGAYLSEADAQTAVDNLGNGAYYLSGAGNAYYGDADFNTVKDSIPVLGEEGGDVNSVNVSSKYVYGRVHKRGIKFNWFKDAIAKDNRPGFLAETAEGLMRAVKELREAEIQSLLLEAASKNVIFPTNANGASMSSLNTNNVLDLATLRAWELKLKKYMVPYATKLVYGSTRVDTKTIDAAWIVYVGSEVVNTLRDMKDSDGNKVFVPAHQYAAGTALIKNEIGSIGKFRFVEVFNMQKWKGAGAAHDDNLPAGYETNGNYDVFPALIVGEDSFDVLDYSANSMVLQTAMPKVIPGVDDYGEKGTMSIKYWVGILVRHPERIQVAKFCIRY